MYLWKTKQNLQRIKPTFQNHLLKQVTLFKKQDFQIFEKSNIRNESK